MISRERILSKTNNGYNIITHYVDGATAGKSFRNPFRKDSHPSCRLKLKNYNGTDIWVMKDYGSSEWCGDCFAIAAKCCNLNPKTSFTELLETIDRDLSTDANENNTERGIVSTSSPADSTLPWDFKAVQQSFRTYELKYWQRYGITEDILTRYSVSSVKNCKFTHPQKKSFSLYGSYMEPMYGYFFNDKQGIKVYRPFSTMRFMYAGELPHPYVFGFRQLPESGEYIIITGGEKDVMSLAARNFPAVAYNSESARIPESEIVKLYSRFKHIIIMYDCDETGKKESLTRVQEYVDKYAVARLVLPLSGTKQEKDISDFFKLGHTVSELQELITATINK